MLIYYCSDGRAEIDNLIAELALRGVPSADGITCSPAPTPVRTCCRDV
ncbi:hypothetical protein L0Z36_26055 [Burkholderia multivorans]|nr:hypothetical protein [Burkholderia multivorans]UQP02884.1 hypothetical protein L0Z36_26055 [Burkholderia multivorans]